LKEAERKMKYTVKLKTKEGEEALITFQGDFHLGQKVYGALLDVTYEYKYDLEEVLEKE